MSNGTTGSPFDASGLAYIESLYEQFVQDPASVPEDWRAFFEAQGPSQGFVSQRSREELLTRRARWPEVPISRQVGLPQGGGSPAWIAKQSAVLRLIQAYRILGHVCANVDPISLRRKPHVPDLHPESLGLNEADMDTEFHTGNLVAPDYMKLRDIVSFLRDCYTGSVGIEYMFLQNPEQKDWLMQRIESSRAQAALGADEKRRLLAALVAAEGLERYCHTRFSGKKRFSLEGLEAMIPVIHEMVQRAGEQGVEEVVLGMAHRGRLNVLTNVMGKAPSVLFREFNDHVEGINEKMVGDVKYHAGFSSEVQTPGGVVHLALAFNPSHLEIINPVIVGSARARQDRNHDKSRKSVLPLLIHGDAAMAGQGVVYETLQLSLTRGYATGGSIHLVTNNQIGFTTSHPLDARSSMYCTDVGKVTGCPIFHVNGDDPEAALWAIRTAVDFRMRFRTDVFIDLVGYRRHGHNEGDEPAVTQPRMYRVIRQHESVPAVYAERLIAQGVVSSSDVSTMVNAYRDALDEGAQVAPNILARDLRPRYYQAWKPFLHGNWRDPAKTAVSVRTLKKVGRLACTVPEKFTFHPAVKKLIEDRVAMVEGKAPLDWGCAETLAYASLLNQNFSVRISGQDSGRGTFFHRHAAVHDFNTGERYVPLAKMTDGPSRFQVYDSILSEVAVLGFEYGYSMTDPHSLVIWEAQYGDFANGAQVVIDQFFSSSQQKWNLFSGLVVMLPHGWEGQGPEHTSARLERFLQLCAQENMQVVVPSTAAQMFHVLRRQMVRKIRIPLIVMSPKSMLRRKESFSTLEDLSSGAFQTVIGETDAATVEGAAKVTRVLMCSGRIYYELAKLRDTENLRHIGIVRVEQLYPFDQDRLMEELARFPRARELVWCQEEPVNQGAWYQIRHRLQRCVTKKQELLVVARPACSAPAGGSPQRHNERERILLHTALGLSAPTYSQTE